MHALVTADTIGGVWTYARELVSGLVRRGVRVTLVSFGDIPSTSQTAWLEGLEKVDFRPTAFRLEWMQEAEEDIAESSEYLASIVRETRPDILHLSQFCYGALPVDVPRIVVAHSDVVSWWVAVHGEEPRESRWMNWYRETVSRGLKGATSVVAPSRWMLDAIAAYYSRPQNSSVIYNGRTPFLFNPHVSKERYIVSAGRLWDGGKQTSLLKQINVPVPTYIAGAEEHPDHRNPQPVPSKKRESSKVICKGQQGEAQLRHLFARASIYAATSRYEPFGLAPLEAALSRCAIVANDIPSFHEIWDDDACYFRLNDAQGLERILRRLTADEQLRSSLANRAYERARKLYTADKMVDSYLGLYHSLVRAEATAA